MCLKLRCISADPSARGSAPGSYDAKCVLTEPATCGLHGLGTKPAGVRGPPKVLEAHSATLFVVAVSHGLGTNPAAVRRFRKPSAKGLGRKGFGSSFSDIVRLMRFVGNISALFVVAVSHGLGTNPAAVRRLRKRSAKGLGR